jgi:hypothetical protein
MNDDKDGKKRGGLNSLRGILHNYNIEEKPRYVTKEFQDYGYRLAVELNDRKHVGMYIKLAKVVDRAVLEQARSFIKDAQNVKNKSRLFLWKMKTLRQKVKKTSKK